MKKILFFLGYFFTSFTYQKTLLTNLVQKDKILSSFVFLNFLKAISLTFAIVFLLNSHDQNYFSKNREIVIYSCLTTFFFIVNFWVVFYRYKKIFIVLYICQFVFYFINISYISYNHNYLPLLNYFSFWKEGFSMLKGFSIPIEKSMIFLFLDTIPFVFLIRRKNNNFFFSIKKSIFVFIFVLCFVFSTVLADLLFFQKNIGKISNNDSSILLRKKKRRFLVMNGFIVYNFTFSVINNLFYSRYSGFLKDTNPILSSHAREVNYKTNSSIEEPYNFIFIQIESFPAGIIEEKYRGKYVTPFLNKLSKQSNALYVKYMLNYHEGGGSFDSTFAVLNNIEPLRETGLHFFTKEYLISNSLVSVFKEQNKIFNYKAYSFENLFPWFFNARQMLTKMSFDFHFSNEEMYPKKYHDKFLSPDFYMFDFVIDRINQKKESPFCYFITTMATHGPFTAVNEFYSNQNYTPLYQKRETHVANYLNSLSSVDEQIQKLFTNLYKKFPNTYVIIYGDHTITDTQYKKPAIKKEDYYLEFTPLLIVAPKNIKINKKINSVAFAHDISATILPLSKLSYQYRLRGYNILDKDFDKTPIHFYNLKLDRKKIYKKLENLMKQKKEKFR